MLKFASKCEPVPAALELVYQAGFRHTELWLNAAVLADWPTALRHTQDYPLSYALHFPNSLNLAPETLEQTVALYRGVAARCVIIHQPMFDRYAEALLRLEPALALAIETHNLTPEQFDRWAERGPGLTLDVEHLWKYTLRNAPLNVLLFDAWRRQRGYGGPRGDAGR